MPHDAKGNPLPPGYVDIVVSLPKYQDHRQGAPGNPKAIRTRTPAVPPPPVGAGKGFRGI